MLPGLMSGGVGGGAAACAKTPRGTNISDMTSTPANFMAVRAILTQFLIARADSIEMRQTADEDGCVRDRHRGERRAVQLARGQPLKGRPGCHDRRHAFLAEKV